MNDQMVPDKKPQNIEGYRKWLKEIHNVDISQRTISYYQSVTESILKDLKKKKFWTELNNNLKEFGDEYNINTGYPLFSLSSPSAPELELVIKPFDSFLLKTFRINCLDNKNWPRPPSKGWVTPENWFTRINDIVRTYCVVKYADGTKFLAEKFTTSFDKYQIKSRIYYEAREEGYYAAHIYATSTFEVPKENWDTKKIDVQFEIHITTQLQEVLRKLLRKYYEERRSKIKDKKIKWQWEFDDDEEFSANYIGHMLHYIEGVILNIRQRQSKGKV